jgi:hypothetical protein
MLSKCFENIHKLVLYEDDEEIIENQKADQSEIYGI